MTPAGENIDFTISASYDVGKAKGKIVEREPFEDTGPAALCCWKMAPQQTLDSWPEG